MPSGLFSRRQHLQAVTSGIWSDSRPISVDYLVVAGGGGASQGGGGAGGLLQGSIPVTTGSALTVTVGSGGGAYTQGQNSVFSSIVAIGGGAGTSGTGGSGGGGNNAAGQQGTFGQGNTGGAGSATASPYAGGGGGGAGTVGLNATSTVAGNGGAGIASAISGIITTYAGGGGGGGPTNGTGGVGGGGNGDADGKENTGGGGGGGYAGGPKSGGSGIVIVSYPDIYAAAASTTGSPTVSTSGSGSINCAGSNACFYYGGQSGFAMGTGDFTIEMWLNPNVTAQNEFYDCRAIGGAGGPYQTIYANLGRIYYFANSADRISGTTVLSNNVWYHIAVCRSGTSTKMFLNGVQEGSTFTDTLNYVVGANRPVIMGNGTGSPGSTVFNGKISNLRVIKGTALYTANFTPPAAPLSPVTNTTLLLGAVSGAYLADGSISSYVASIAGAPVWNSSSPFATGLGYKNRVYQWTSSGSITF